MEGGSTAGARASAGRRGGAIMPGIARTARFLVVAGWRAAEGGAGAGVGVGVGVGVGAVEGFEMMVFSLGA